MIFYQNTSFNISLSASVMNPAADRNRCALPGNFTGTAVQVETFAQCNDGV